MAGMKEAFEKFAQKNGMAIPSSTAKEEPKNKAGDKMKRHLDNVSLTRKEAHAPYNFVPLNESVVAVEPFLENDRYHEDRLTGYIDCNLKTLTPVYIRDTYTDEDIKKHNEMERKGGKEKYIVPDFFSPTTNGKPRIPGSSLRGMIRTLVEIVSWSKFGFFEKDRKYHFRSFADRSLNLRRKYADKLLCGDYEHGFSQDVKAGYLIKDRTEFKIKPAQIINNTQFFRVEEDLVINNGVLTECMNRILHDEKYIDNPAYKFGFKKVKFVSKKPKKDTNHSIPMYYAEVTDICEINQHLNNAFEGMLVYSGWMRGPRYRPKGKHLHWVVGPASNQKIDFLPGVIEDYKNDTNRHEDANLLRYFKNNPQVEVPCFYVEENGKVESFGHTGLFRLAYKYKLNDFLPEEMQQFEGTDIAEAIFGNESSFAGRVFFEDALLSENQTDVLMKVSTPQILSEPKPTTFQHYLVQHQEITNRENGIYGLQNYNDDTWLRGNKLYWHKSGENWEEKDKGKIEKHKTQYTRIRPVKPETEFKFRIRFENLSKEELGALLFALNLPEDCAHKIGMGKPLGLGSVEITPTLVLSDREKRYKSLFDGNNWALAENEDNIKEHTDYFEKHILGKINPEEKEGAILLWDTYRLKQLKTMLDFEKGKQLEKDGKIRYMQIEGLNNNEFKDRNVLPIPEKV